MRITFTEFLLSPLPLAGWLMAIDNEISKQARDFYFWAGSLLALIFPILPYESLILSVGLIIWYLSKPIREKLVFIFLRNTFRKEFISTLISLSTVVRSGAPISSAIQYVGKRSRGIVRKELDRWFLEFTLSGSPIPAIKRSAKDWKFPSLTILATTVAISTKTGGSIAPYLEEIAQSLKNELKNEERIRTLTLTARLQGYITIPVPLIAFAIMHNLEPDLVNASLHDSKSQMIYLLALLLQLLGAFWIISSGRRK